MTSDPAEHARDALNRRAKRGDERGADAVLDGARSEVTIPTPASRRGAPDPRRRATLAAAALVLVAVIAAVTASRLVRDDQQAASPTESFCGALAAPAGGPDPDGADVVFYLEPGLSPAESTVGTMLRVDSRVAQVVYVDRAETFARFQRLFADDEAVLENVTAEDLPTSFKVTMADVTDRDNEAESLAADFQYEPDLWGTTIVGPPARALDVLVAPGTEGALRAILDRFQVNAEIRATALETVRSFAPPEVTEPLTVLMEHFDRESEDWEGLVGPPPPSVVRAATFFAEFAQSKCNLEPAAWATESQSTTGTDAADTTKSAPPVASPTTAAAPATTEPG